MRHSNTDGLLRAVDSDVTEGIKVASLDAREKEFGTHEKPEP